MIDEYEVAFITTPLHSQPTYRLLIAFEQAGRHFRRCAACDGFHYMGDEPGMKPMETRNKNRLHASPRTLRGRIPSGHCPHKDARDDPRQKIQRSYAERIERGEEVAPVGWS